MRWSVVFVCLVAATGFTQDFPRAEIFGGASYANIDTNGLSSRQNAAGWESSVSVNALQWIGGEADFSGYYKSIDGVPIRDYSVAAGPRFNVKPIFVHALFGMDRLSASAFGESAHQNGFAGEIGGGVEFPVIRYLAVRVSADDVFTRHNIFGGSRYTQNNVRASLGIVYRFGFHSAPVAAVPATRSASQTASATSMPVPSLGISVVTTEGNKGAQITDVTPGGVGDFGGLHRTDIITAIDGKDVHTPMELAAALSGGSGKVTVGYVFHTSALGWIGKVTTVVIGK